jgi:hypothetical protein
MYRVTSAIAIVLLFILAQAVRAQDTAAGPASPGPCTGPAYRAFDFWLGEWEVTTPAREGWTASSSITVSNDGCSIDELYRAPSGLGGKSITFYDAARNLWHQTWMDNRGSALYLDGNLEGGVMVLSDDTSRVSWSLLADGQVRQHWESTTDKGKTWVTAFDGYYGRKPGSGAPGATK